MPLFKTRSGKTDWQVVGTVAVTLLTGALILGGIGLKVASDLHTHEATIQVVKKERLANMANDGPAFVHHVEGPTDIYTVTDSLFKWHWYSGQTYSDIELGICDVTLQGFRIGFLSMKYNILKADCDNYITEPQEHSHAK